MISFDFQFEKKAFNISIKAALLALKQLSAIVTDNRYGHITIRVLDQKNIQKLNKKYANKNESTDVLSFNYNEGLVLPTERDSLGDVAISYQQVILQADKSGTNPDTELALLSIHGVLHILGYDHKTKADQTSLNSLQKQIMETAGLVYRDFYWYGA